MKLFSIDNATTTAFTDNATTAFTAITNITTAGMSFPMNQTTPTPTDATFPQYAGYISAAVSCLFFGSNFVPIKKYETGDGMFFQWVMTTAIWCVGLIVHAVQGFPKFYPLAMLGGFLWATGNICVVTIVKCIGLSIGLLIWGTFNLLAGWASGRFGWFGLTPEVPDHPPLNYAGVAMAVLSVILFLFIKPTIREIDKPTPIKTHQPTTPSNEEERSLLLYGSTSRHETSMSSSDYQSKDSSVQVPRPAYEATGNVILDRLSPIQRRIAGVLLAAASGIFYGLCFAPVIYIQDNYDGASKSGLDYVFAHFCGIYATSVVYFVIYCIFMKNEPKVYPRAILPGILSGAMWAVAQTGWFIANQTLSEAVSFPIITTGPAIIAALWGVFIFREIQGWRNLIILVLAFCVTIGGALLSAFSKE